MANIEKLSISLPSEIVDFVKDAVERGEYATVSEAVREALRDWQQENAYKRAVKSYGLTKLRAMVKEGVDALDRGEGIPSAKVREELTSRYRAMAKRKRQKTPA